MDTPILSECMISYTIFPNGNSLLVKISEAKECYVGILLDSDLNEIDRYEVNDLSQNIVYATITMLNDMDNFEDVHTIVFDKNLAPFNERMTIEVDDDLIEKMESVSTEALKKLVDDPCIDMSTKSAMHIVLTERSLIDEDHDA